MTIRIPSMTSLSSRETFTLFKIIKKKLLPRSSLIDRRQPIDCRPLSNTVNQQQIYQIASETFKPIKTRLITNLSASSLQKLTISHEEWVRGKVLNKPSKCFTNRQKWKNVNERLRQSNLKKRNEKSLGFRSWRTWTRSQTIHWSKACMTNTNL